MNAADASVKIAGFAVLLVVAFGAAFGLGRAVGPVGGDAAPAAPSATSTTVAGHGGHS